MAKSKTYKMVSTWTYIVSGGKGYHEFEGTKKQCLSMADYQRNNLRGYGTDIEIKVIKNA